MAPPRTDSRKLILTACVTLAVIAGGLYWWSRKSEQVSCSTAENSSSTAAQPSSTGVSKLSKKDVIAIMDRVIDTQHSLRALLNDVVEKIRSNELVGTKSLYEYIQKKQPIDPLEAHGLTMAEFDQLMSQWQDDPDVTSRTYTIVNGPTYENDRPEDLAVVNTFSVEKIIEIHEGILKRVTTAHAEVKSLEKTIEAGMLGGKSIEKRAVAILLQALVAEYTLTNHNISAEALEIRVMQSQNSLVNRPDYLSVHSKIQEIMDYATAT